MLLDPILFAILLMFAFAGCAIGFFGLQLWATKVAEREDRIRKAGPAE